MPRSQSISESREARNRERLKMLLRQEVERMREGLRAELCDYERAAQRATHAAVEGQIKHLKNMILACGMLSQRFALKTRNNVPQEVKRVAD